MAFSDDLIRAAVHTGEYSDPAAEAHLAAVLIKRRDAVGRAYLTAINPIVNPQLDAAGRLTFENAAVAAGFAPPPRAYRVVWSRFDNATAAVTRIGNNDAATASLAAPGPLPAEAGSVRRDRHQRRRQRASHLAAAGAHAFPAHREWLEAGRPRSAARQPAAGARAGARRDESSLMTVPPDTAIDAHSDGTPDKGLIERLLSPIADVHRGEGVSALLMTATMFLLLGGYYLLKTAREGFILSEGGAEMKSYSSAGQAVLLLALVPAYGAIASRVSRIQLIQWVTLFFAGNLALFLVALSAGLHIGIIYFLWVGIFNVMVIAQFWGFAADLYSEEQGKRLFPLIGVGASLGAWIGSVRAGALAKSAGSSRLLLGGAVILVICVALARIVNGMKVPGAHGAKREGEKLKSGPSGFSMVFTDRYLTLMALLVLILNVVNTSGEYIFGKYVVNAAVQTYGSDAASQAAARAVHQRDLQQLLRLREPDRVPAADLRRLARVPLPWRRARAVHPSNRRLDRLRRDASRAVVRIHPLGEDRRQQPGLFAGEYDQAGALAADQPRSEVQGEAGRRFVLPARRRRAPGRHRLFRRADVAEHQRLRGAEHHLRRRLARSRAWTTPSPARARRAGGCRGAITPWTKAPSSFSVCCFLLPEAFPPLSALVHAEIGASTRRRAGESPSSDHYLVVRLGRNQETLLTSLPPEAIPKRFDEHAYGMVVADGMGSLGDVASGLSVAGLLQLALRFGRWNLRVDDLLAPDIIERITHFFRQIDSALVNVNRQGGVAPLYSTLTAVVSAGRDLFFAHVGHSRAYLFRSGALIQLTRDHTRALRRETDAPPGGSRRRRPRMRITCSPTRSAPVPRIRGSTSSA